ncbi:MAG: zinc ribbon domain-containing protein [Leptolyngbya sp. PLA3]|nr:MAG: zinc ribbon domain-containing protein [Cyanobacteria bacterium CYA]MCE7968906.1 zinc ribbon domain-containing protein [Leptolyngbya sp. PL-A3]
MQWQDSDIGEGLDPDGPSAEDLDRFGDEFRTCPNCGRQIYDQADICPHCREAIIDKPAGAKWWVILVVVIVLIFFAFAIL